MAQKAEAQEMVGGVGADGSRLTQKAVADFLEVSPSLISKWCKPANVFITHRMISTKRKKRKRLGAGRPARFPAQEDLLYMAFYNRRVYQGLRVTHRWLRLRFKLILLSEQPEGWLTCKLSSGWSSRFCKRYQITDQAKTNKKLLPLSDRIPRIQRFHTFLIYGLQCSGVERDPKYGRFPPEWMFYCDQIPLPFVYGKSRTLNPSAMDCWLAQPGDGLEKRQATLHLTIRAEGPQVAKPGVVFRGQGLVLTDWEKSQYPDSVRVYFQPKAWVDTPVMTCIVDDFLEDLEDVDGEVMYGLDNLGAHHNTAIKAKLAANGVIPVFTPSQCTDVVAPVDHHIGAWMKQCMSYLYERELELNLNRWEDGGLSAAERRIFIVNWVACAWESLKTKAEFIRQAFVTTGWLLAKDGSENHLVVLKKWAEAYDFPRPAAEE
jgi:hypothetical protein